MQHLPCNNISPSLRENSLSFLNMFFSSCISPCNEICKYTQLQLSTVKVMWSQYIKLQKFYSCQCECPWSRPGILLCFSWCPASMSKYDTVSVLLFSLLPTILSHVPWTEHKAEISTAGGEALWIYLLMSSLLRLREAPYIPKNPELQHPWDVLSVQNLTPALHTEIVLPFSFPPSHGQKNTLHKQGSLQPNFKPITLSREAPSFCIKRLQINLPLRNGWTISVVQNKQIKWNTSQASLFNTEHFNPNTLSKIQETETGSSSGKCPATGFTFN